MQNWEKSWFSTSSQLQVLLIISPLFNHAYLCLLLQDAYTTRNSCCYLCSSWYKNIREKDSTSLPAFPQNRTLHLNVLKIHSHFNSSAYFCLPLSEQVNDQSKVNELHCSNAPGFTEHTQIWVYQDYSERIGKSLYSFLFFLFPYVAVFMINIAFASMLLWNLSRPL